MFQSYTPRVAGRGRVLEAAEMFQCFSLCWAGGLRGLAMLMFQCYGLCGGAVGLSWATMEVKGWGLQCFGVGATPRLAWVSISVALLQPWPKSETSGTCCVNVSVLHSTVVSR
jgi:hypothetical protein